MPSLSAGSAAPALKGLKQPATVRWIPPLRLEGAWQMAIDEHLLDRALADPSAGPSFRLYRWSRPTVSLGYHQRIVPPHWRTLAAQGLIDLVRRPTGGRAVLHGQDLSYALIWPAAPEIGRAHV